MDACKLFRVLIYVSIGLLAAAIGALFIEPDPPEEVMRYFDEEAAGPLFALMNTDSMAGLVVTAILAAVFLVAWLAALVGMLDFRPWARTVFIVTAIVSYAMLPLSGSSYAGPLQGTLDALVYTVDGALLVLLFVEPIRGRFSPAWRPESGRAPDAPERP
jgi:hypothetical protein